VKEGTNFKKENLNNVKFRIETNIKEMGRMTFKHVLRDNNAEANSHASQGSNRHIGQVKENYFCYEKPIL